MTDVSLVTNFKDTSPVPRLSVLVPYYHDNPGSLLKALAAQVSAGADAEILLYDDGTNDGKINDQLKSLAKQSKSPIKLIFAHKNCGRSAARNALQDSARADWILFLDADMMPETDHFLADYIALIETESVDVIFGGFKMPPHATHDTALHHAFSASSDCLSAEERTQSGPQYVCSSNLCSRRKILDQDPFDVNFKGWGWEDSEWAARIASKYTLLHADIPALHLGLESTETLLSRFKNSAPNYDLFTSKHPELAQSLTLFKTMKTLRRLPAQKVMRPVLSALVRNRIRLVPMCIRLVSLKLWRASWYAERCGA